MKFSLKNLAFIFAIGSLVTTSGYAGEKLRENPSRRPSENTSSATAKQKIKEETRAKLANLKNDVRKGRP